VCRRLYTAGEARRGADRAFNCRTTNGAREKGIEEGPAEEVMDASPAKWQAHRLRVLDPALQNLLSFDAYFNHTLSTSCRTASDRAS